MPATHAARCGLTADSRSGSKRRARRSRSSPRNLAAPAAPPVEIQGGYRYEIELAPDATSVRVHARAAGAERSWRLPVSAGESDVLAPARAALDKGEFEAARATVEEVLPSARDATRAAALGLLARIALGAA
jgi:hypothetical protein